MRTKEEIIKILAKRKFQDMLASSTWLDLVKSISTYTPEEKDRLVKLIATGSSKKAGERLKQLLVNNAQNKALAEVQAMLDDDSLSLAEIDSLI